MKKSIWRPPVEQVVDEPTVRSPAEPANEG
jgi:hypothetical protein